MSLSGLEPPWFKPNNKEYQMNNFEIFSKLVAISIVGGVAKALFSQPKQQGSTSAIADAVVSSIGDASKRTNRS